MISNHLDALLASYGYGAVALFIFLESTGVPSPGETMLITAGAYAGATHRLEIVWVVVTAWLAAVVGDNVGFAIGREGGWRLVRGVARRFHVDDRTLKIGVYLFRCYGGRVVFFGRFVPLLRTWGALLAGVNRMPWRRFLVWNGTSALAWATLWGGLSYTFGSVLQAYAANIAFIAIGVAAVISAAVSIALARTRRELAAKADAALPGDLARY